MCLNPLGFATQVRIHKYEMHGFKFKAHSQKCEEIELTVTALDRCI